MRPYSSNRKTSNSTWGIRPSEANTAPSLNAASINPGGVAHGAFVAQPTPWCPIHCAVNAPPKPPRDTPQLLPSNRVGGILEISAGRNTRAEGSCRLSPSRSSTRKRRTAYSSTQLLTVAAFQTAGWAVCIDRRCKRPDDSDSSPIRWPAEQGYGDRPCARVVGADECGPTARCNP